MTPIQMRKRSDSNSKLYKDFNFIINMVLVFSVKQAATSINDPSAGGTQDINSDSIVRDAELFRREEEMRKREQELQRRQREFDQVLSIQNT